MAAILGIYASQISGHLYAGPFGAYDALASVTLSGNATSIVLSGIPNTYKHIQLRWAVRSTTAGTAQDEVQLQLGNGSIDTGSNYAYHFMYGNGSSAVASYQDGQGQIRAAFAPRASATANSFGVAVVDILDYASTTKYKVVRSLNGGDLNDSNGLSAMCSGLWMSQSPITTISIKPESGNSFPANSTLALYGVK